MTDALTRRSFLAQSLAGSAVFGAAWGSEPLPSSVPPVKEFSPNEKIAVGFIGLGGMGTGTLNGFLSHKDVDVLAVCDVYEPHVYRAREIVEKSHRPAPDTYKDFRRVLERKDIDAVVVSTPDHWHAIPSILACQADKDVYCEKPLVYCIDEGKTMVKAARENKRITQMGTQVHAGENYRRVVE
ncbi:MAG: Gfo/Idh/MocA family oxidoreductase, partial [Planctomycetes bacterium]|nr:Gfo/Idh/MocA family oxidoreductase [Planctomycetota bacterium]